MPIHAMHPYVLTRLSGAKAKDTDVGIQQHMYEIITGELGMGDTCDLLKGKSAPLSVIYALKGLHIAMRGG